MAQLTDYQKTIALQSLRAYGELALAADNAGVRVRQLNRLIEEDEDFAAEVEHALGVFSSAISVAAQHRAAAGSDLILSRLLEAKVAGFSRESRQTSASTSKPTVITLRQFDNEGAETEPAKDTGPLLLPLRKGI